MHENIYWDSKFTRLKSPPVWFPFINPSKCLSHCVTCAQKNTDYVSTLSVHHITWCCARANIPDFNLIFGLSATVYNKLPQTLFKFWEYLRVCFVNFSALWGIDWVHAVEWSLVSREYKITSFMCLASWQGSTKAGISYPFFFSI